MHVLGVGYSHLAQILVVGQLNIRVRVAMEPRAPNTSGAVFFGKSRLSLSHKPGPWASRRNRLIHLEG